MVSYISPCLMCQRMPNSLGGGEVSLVKTFDQSPKVLRQWGFDRWGTKLALRHIASLPCPLMALPFWRTCHWIGRGWIGVQKVDFVQFLERHFGIYWSSLDAIGLESLSDAWCSFLGQWKPSKSSSESRSCFRARFPVESTMCNTHTKVEWSQ